VSRQVSRIIVGECAVTAGGMNSPLLPLAIIRSLNEQHTPQLEGDFHPASSASRTIDGKKAAQQLGKRRGHRITSSKTRR
jgi:hypothetical protein